MDELELALGACLILVVGTAFMKSILDTLVALAWWLLL